jgi:hypothetical protein
MKNTTMRLSSAPKKWLLGLVSLGASWPALAQTTSKSAKRGEGYGYHSAADLKVISPGISWWYNWAPMPDAGAASTYQGLGVEFVPMQWNKDLDGGTVTADKLAAKIPAGAKYLLGFNEPNFKSQANLTPTQAAAVWPVLQEVARRKNLKLVSPALNYCGDCVSENGTTYYSPTQYLDAFFAACPSCQVDYIALHTYVCEEQYLRQKVAELKKYNKPIWLTEFACGDMEASKITLGVQQKYMQDALNYLEREPAIFRYAWFAGRNNEIPNINLLGADGQLTALGQQYVAAPFNWQTGRLTPVAATASSTQANTPATTPAQAIDGDINTRWASSWADPQYLQLDYGSVKDITRVVLSWEPAYAADYQLQTSTDGANWTTIRTVLNSDGGVDDHTGLSGRGRYLRVYGTRRATSYGYSLYEVDAFGAATATTVPAASPTLIQAESYSSMSGVGLETTADTNGGQDVGWIDTGDAMTYNSVVFPTSGSYTIEYRVASPSGGSLSASLNGTTQLGTVAVPATGGWQTWRTVSQTVNVTAGTYTFGIQVPAGGWNINWLRITPPAAATASKAAASTSATASTLTASKLQVYPNPVADQLHLQTESETNLAGSRYQVLDAYGQVKAQGVITEKGLDMSGLPMGAYTLRLITPTQQQLTRPFLKH